MADRRANRAYLALGSNIDPERNLPAAAALLARYGKVMATSQVWETAPVGFLEQPNFLNAAVLLETYLSAEDLRAIAIAQIESQLNRVRDPHNVNAPRTIDVDIALYNNEILTIGPKRIPDPQILERAFVVVPLAEVDPQYVHPEVGVTLTEIAKRFDAAGAAMTARPDVVIGKRVAANRPE